MSHGRRRRKSQRAGRRVCADYTDCVVGKVCEKGCLEAKKPILIKKEDQGDGSYEYECGLCSDIKDESDNPTFPFLYGDQCIT